MMCYQFVLSPHILRTVSTPRSPILFILVSTSVARDVPCVHSKRICSLVRRYSPRPFGMVVIGGEPVILGALCITVEPSIRSNM
jgi:hypothetical protein